MSTLEIKGGLHELISKVNDEKLLQELYELVSDIVLSNTSEIDFWDELPEEQKLKLEEAIGESYNDNNLIEHEVFAKKYKKWLKE